VVIKGITADHQRTAGVEGEIRNVEKEAKHRSEENPNAPPAKIMHPVPAGVQAAEIVDHLTARNSLTRNTNGTQTKKTDHQIV
jgi:hypothetical protein